MPYFGTCRWYRSLLGGYAKQPAGHALTRTELVNGTLLSLPAEGGYRRVRRCRSEKDYCALTLSDHADWQRVHIGAIRALYGRSPYFSHYFPHIESIISNARRGENMADFTKALHCSLFSAMFSTENLQPFWEMKKLQPELFNSLHNERSYMAADNISILHPLFNLGPEMMFALL